MCDIIFVCQECRGLVAIPVCMLQMRAEVDCPECGRRVCETERSPDIND